MSPFSDPSEELDFPPGVNAPGVSDIADLAGVDRITVGDVLDATNQLGYV